MKRFIGAFALLTLMTACASVVGPKLSGAELRQKVPGNTFHYSGVTMRLRLSGRLTFNRNGTLSFKTGSGIPESGTWRIAGDKLCTKLVRLRGGREVCYSVNSTGPGTYRTSNGFSVKAL